MKKTLAILILLVCAAALVLVLRSSHRKGLVTQDRLEAKLQRQGKVLLRVDYRPTADTAGRIVRFDAGVLARHQLFATHSTERGTFVYIDPLGNVISGGTQWGTLAENAELLMTRSHGALFVDGTAIPVDLGEWHINWVADSREPPAVETESIPRTEFTDSFMRHEIANDYCRLSAGVAELAQRGGGMAETEEEMLDFEFQRAVNPFSVRMRDGGTLSYDVARSGHWGDLHGEARFYFGAPKTGNVVDVDTVPAGTDMLVAIGRALSGEKVAFGWRGESRAFCLMQSRHGDDWTVIATREGPRPPVTSWVKIGIEVLAERVVVGLLDGVPVLRCEMTCPVRGAVHVMGGRGMVEVDDVAGWSMPRQTAPGEPLHVESRQFARKQMKSATDPPQFREWASSTGVFSKERWREPGTDMQNAAIVTAMPLMGDFQYDAVPFSDASGPLPPGDYEFLWYASQARRAVSVSHDRPVARLRATRTDEGWTVQIPHGGREVRTTALRISRGAGEGRRVCVADGDRWLPATDPVEGPVHMAIRRLRKGDLFLFSPSPQHHSIRCRNLVNEFFETAPTDWSWVDGAFRMDCRWACEKQWNFMACGSTELPYMASKRVFEGDQTHEYFLSLRSALPWDAGDKSFSYDPAADAENGYKIHINSDGWYNRHDLNFSFCCDGHNPLSGYAILFAADDDTETQLLRQGQVVARTNEKAFIIPRDAHYHAFHWNWWKFTVRKSGDRIIVCLNDEIMFDYQDPRPLSGGHIGFWSVRNGFAISRVASIAERLGWDPGILYVAEDVDSLWRPLKTDSVALSAATEDGNVTVTNAAGGGFFAVRRVFDPPIDLRRTPVLELPLDVPKDASLALHLGVGGKSCVLPLAGAPTANMKALLTPEFERGECFRLPDLDPHKVVIGPARISGGKLTIDLGEALRRLPNPPMPVLESLTLGNTSNARYALAGNRVNAAGTSYTVGEPEFRGTLR